jgi:hypothetical protein
VALEASALADRGLAPVEVGLATVEVGLATVEVGLATVELDLDMAAVQDAAALDGVYSLNLGR